MERSIIATILVLAILIIASNYLSTLGKTGISHETTQVTTTTTTTLFITPTGMVELPESVTYGSASIKVPAVDNEGNGVVTWLKVIVLPGEGRVLVDINQLLFWVDTQYSIRVAEYVAENVTGVNVTNMDFIYGIETEASLVEGPSAGAALTVATIAALENKTINPNIMITGTISLDGTIGPVGGVVEKALAAKDVGATTFLVPEGQSVQIYYIPQRSCERIGPITYCTTTYNEEKIDVSETVEIEIKEVSNINEAVGYFLE